MENIKLFSSYEKIKTECKLNPLIVPTVMKYVRDEYDNLIDKYPVKLKYNEDAGILEEFDEYGNLVDNTGLNYSYAIGHNL